VSDPPVVRDERPIDRLLSRPLRESDLDRNTEALARVPAAASSAGDSLLLFDRCGEAFALPATSVTRVFPPCPVHRIPHRPGPIFRGIASERGELRLVASLEALLELPPSAVPIEQAKRRMLLVDVDGEAWLFEADSVVGVVRSVRTAWIEPPPTITHRRGRTTSFLVPIGSRRAALLDPSRVVAAFRESVG